MMSHVKSDLSHIDYIWFYTEEQKFSPKPQDVSYLLKVQCGLENEIQTIRCYDKIVYSFCNSIF